MDNVALITDGSNVVDRNSSNIQLQQRTIIDDCRVVDGNVVG